MKKTLSMVLVVAMLALSVFALASCGLSGSYVDPTGLTTLEFSGSNVTITTESGAMTLTYNAQYEISDKDGGKVITFTYAEGEDVNYLYKGEKSYAEGSENGVDYIKIGGVKYTKQ